MRENNLQLAASLTRIKEFEVSSLPCDNEIDHIFSESFERETEKLFQYADGNIKNTAHIRNMLSKAAAIAAIILIGMLFTLSVNPKVRADFKNTVIEFYEAHMKFSFISSQKAPGDFTDTENITVGYTPDGFKLKNTYDEYEAKGFRYENEEKNLSYDIYISENDGLSVMTGKGEETPEKITVSGREAYLICGENNEKAYSTLIITGGKITVTVFGQIDRKEILKIGRSVGEK